MGQINTNSLRNKCDALIATIAVNTDILLIAETKIDFAFPANQFYLMTITYPADMTVTLTMMVFWFMF